MVDRTYVGRTKYSYKDLLKRELPEDVDPQHKEVREILIEIVINLVILTKIEINVTSSCILMVE